MGRGGGRGGGGGRSNNGGYGGYGGGGGDDDDAATAAAARVERARNLRRQRLANLRREDAALDAKFGFDEYDARAVASVREGVARRERRAAMLDRARRDDVVSAAGGPHGDADDDDDDDCDGGVDRLLPPPPGACGTRRGWVFNMVPTTLPPAPDDDEDAATGGRHTDDGKSSSSSRFGDDDGGGGGDGGGDDGGNERSGVELFLIDGEKRRFKATVVHQPYFFLIPEDKTVGVGAAMTTTMMVVGGGGCGNGASTSSADAERRTDELRAQDAHDLQYHYQDLLAALTRLYQPSGLRGAEILRKMDLDAPNHLGARSQALGGRPMVKLVFDNVDQLQRVKREVSDVLRANERRRADGGGDDGGGGGFDLLQTSPSVSMYDADHDGGGGGDVAPTAVERDPLSSLLDIREHDVPYLVRACIDLNLRAGCWYTLTPLPSGGVVATDRATLPKANPVVLAFDIECTKAPLKFPDADHDTIFMISYMVDGMGYLLLSRHVVGGDVSNFEYTPKPKYPGPFVVMNEPTEEALIRRFLHEFDRSCPQIVVTYNGDFFDWPFLEKRAAVYGLDLRREIGFYNAAASTEGGGGGGGGGGGSFGGGGSADGSEYRGRTAVHLDAFCWVKRDSYLPQGSQGLKAVTKYKLGYDPVEVDPEDMVRYARERPAHMASYSVSDAVATYYLYDKYVHMFIFSLCTIIPMGPEDVLRKGSGELFLMGGGGDELFYAM